MEVSEAVAILRTTPDALERLLAIDDATLRDSMGEGWSAKEYVGHLCDSIEVWDGRLQRTALEDRPFLPGYDQEEYVRERGHQDADLRPRLEAAKARRAETLALIEGLSDADWERIGVHGERGPMTLREILFSMGRHERHHLDDIKHLLEPESRASAERIDLAYKFSLFTEYWKPKIVGEVNDNYVKLVKARGEFDWHHHELEDELFLVLRGRLIIRLRDGEVELGPGEMTIIPRGVEHRPFAEEEVQIMLLEPKTTLNTGNVQTEKTLAELERI